ncbi:MAG: acyl-CoA dehydratase activase-related protein, partial [Syntrophales bacterium LBB04]|nr:acyl-CoA dehydratase activase-related protein [Syntrophales bacterium LBB04]
MGTKIFMQGGVCYNKAVPMAQMAALTGKNIVVPPEPGLVGAFGVALEIKRRLKMGLMAEQEFSLQILKDRSFEHRQAFQCHGGKSGCDRKCEITRVRVEGKTYPFGGACNRWYNIRSHILVDADELDLIKQYEKLFFSNPSPAQELSAPGKELPSVGINKSFYVNTLYPFYEEFFRRLGFRVQLPARLETEGIDYKGASFCYPAEIAHGYFINLLNAKPDYLFLPHVKGLSLEGQGRPNTTCPFTQGEPYFLSIAFKDNEALTKLQKQERPLKPVLDFSRGPEQVVDELARAVKKMGVGRREARAAYREAWQHQEMIVAKMQGMCLDALRKLENDRDRYGIVIVGRSYNAFVSEANMGIPQKIASRGIQVLPYAFLPLDDEEAPDSMYWGAGQLIMKSSQFIARHPQLFPCYISNFSCGPDSFLAEYFRHAMGRKPHLMLELDSHVADAGLETRIEAFLDIINNYRSLGRKNEGLMKQTVRAFKPARFDQQRQLFYDSRGNGVDLRDN